MIRLRPKPEEDGPAYTFDFRSGRDIGEPTYGTQQPEPEPEPSLGRHIKQRALDRRASVHAKNEALSRARQIEDRKRS